MLYFPDPQILERHVRKRSNFTLSPYTEDVPILHDVQRPLKNTVVERVPSQHPQVHTPFKGDSPSFAAATRPTTMRGTLVVVSMTS